MLKSIKTFALAVTLVSVVIVSGSNSVTAEENPCAAEIKRLCGDVKPGKGQLNACLEAHKDEISKECKDWMGEKAAQVRSKLEAVQKACSGDIAKLCKGVKPGEGRVLQCLIQHKEEISQECRDSMGEKAVQIRSKLEVVQKACSGDIARLCKGMQPGEGRALGCLMKHKDELSQECKASMAKK